jgi:energy-coupling factor transporter ATP-binding protein EcfA2
MSTLNDFGLIADPFSVSVNDLSVHKWAGREREKQLLLDVVESVLRADIGSSEFVIVHGDYGAGKSHALRYLATVINETNKDHYRSRAVYLRTVRVSEKVKFLDVYRVIIDHLGRQFFDELVAHVANQVHAAMVGYLAEVVPEQRTALMGDQNRHINETLEKWVAPATIPYVKLFFHARNGEVEAVWNYLKGEEGDVENFGLPAKIANDYTAVGALAGVFKVMCVEIGELPPAYEAGYLFVDEQENLVDMKATESVQLLQSFRELINQLSNNFCMIWGFTADAALIEAVLPSPILQRLTRRYIELAPMLPDEAKRFIREHLTHFRQPGFVPTGDFYPFSEAAIDAVLERIVDMTPRNIFKLLRAILERAIRRFELQPQGEISAELANQILDLQLT